MYMVIEGTMVEVRRALDALTVPPAAHVRVVVDAEETPETEEPSLEEFLATAERKNGIITVPLTYRGRTLTTELVKELSENE